MKSAVKRDPVGRFLAAMPEQFRTPTGAAIMLADMSEIGSLRPVAEKWFKKAGRSVQLDLIRSLDEDPARARALLYLAADAGPLLGRLTTLQVRRICDDQSALIGSLKPQQLMNILSLTNRLTVRDEWLAMICEALSDNNEAATALFNRATADDFVSWFYREFRVRDLELLEAAKDDPTVLDDILVEGVRLWHLLFDLNYVLYRESIEAIVAEVYGRYQDRSQKRTGLLLEGRLWRDMHKQLREVGEDH